MFDREPCFEVPAAILQGARSLGAVRVAVVGAAHPLALRSACAAVEHGLIEPVLVGDRAAILAIAQDIGWDASTVEIVEAAGDRRMAEAGVALVREGRAAVLMKGHVQTNAFMGAVVDRQHGLRTEHRITHAFHLSAPGGDRALLISDAAINVAPTVETKVDITAHAVRLMHALGVRQPKVAVLSGTEKATPKMPSSMEAATVAEQVAATLGEACLVSGPLAMDVAISHHAADIKELHDPVAGAADILIVPNIEAGNILYKALVYACGATAAGLVMGATVPVVLTSRADPLEARLASIALARLVTQHGMS